MFNSGHIIFIVISFILILSGEILAGFYIKSDKTKITLLKIFSCLTVMIHYSSLYVDYLTTGSASVDNTMLFLIYPCHVAMWLMVIVAFYKNKQSTFFTIVADFAFYLGVVGGIIGLVFNEIYINNPTFADWSSVKGLFSHATLIFNAIYIYVGGFMNIRVKNVISVIIGMSFLVVDGAAVILLFKLCGLDAPNSMYLLKSPLPSSPIINTWTIGILGVILVFVISATYEFFMLKKPDRWYNKIFKGDKN